MQWLEITLFVVVGAAWWYFIMLLARRAGMVRATEYGWRDMLVLLGLAIWGGLGLEITLIVQPPIQQWYNQLCGFPNGGTTTIMIILAFGTVLISGIVQEILKGVPVWFGPAPARRVRVEPVVGEQPGEQPLQSRLANTARAQRIRTWLTWGAATGFGFGVWEAIRLVGIPMVQSGQGFMLLAFYERFWAIGFHVLTPVLMAAYAITHRTFVGYLIAAFLHGILNYSVILHFFWLIDVTGIEAWCTLGVIVTLALTWGAVRSVFGLTPTAPPPSTQ